MAARLEIATLGYHDVTDDPATSGFPRPGALPYKLGRRAFRDQLARIAAGPVAPTLVTEIDWTRPGRHVLLTFDDGGKSALDAAEQLCRRGWRGHFFIVTARIGAPSFLDPNEIRWLRASGHLVGSHSHTHPDIFRDLTAAQMSEEWRVSRDVLGELLGEPCVVASVPGGDISAAVFPCAAAAGLRYLFTSEAWLRPRRVDGCWVLGRFAPKVGTSATQVQRLTQFRGWFRARALRELRVLARRALPTLYRWYVGRVTREAGAAVRAQPHAAASTGR